MTRSYWSLWGNMRDEKAPSTKVRMNRGERESRDFNVKVGVNQGSVFSPLLFIIVLEALSKEFREGDGDDGVIAMFQCRGEREIITWIYGSFLVLIVLLMWWGMEDWDGLGIWSVRVWMIGCLLVEGWWWRRREVGAGVGRHGNSVLGMTWNCLVCILSGLFLGICGGTWFGANV